MGAVRNPGDPVALSFGPQMRRPDAQDLVIASHDDWRKFQDPAIDTIVDPMIFRAADLFLRGRRGVAQALPASDSDAVWGALDKNIDSLVAFFDAIVLSERLPIIDYGYTFDTRGGFPTDDIYQRCNLYSRDPVLVSVHVTGEVYQTAKDASIRALRDREAVTYFLQQNIRGEMSAFEYQWQPDLSDLGAMDEDERALATFMFGGLLFGAYAQAAEVAHLLQPKRARLHTAAALRAPSASFRDEGNLYQELRRIFGTGPGGEQQNAELTGLPTFLPYLLSLAPGSPDDLLRKAIALRESGEVRDYRFWRTKLIDDWKNQGRITAENESTLQRIALKTREKLGPEGGTPAALGMVALGIDVGGRKGEGKISSTLKELHGWVMEQLPGNRYMKLLMRQRIAEHEYRKLDRALRTLWYAD